jgi:hypothetical protein
MRYRLFIVPKAQRWTIRGASRRIGAFGDPGQALTTALEVASVEAVHGHAVEVLHQDAQGRWLRVSAVSTTVWAVRPDGVAAIRN